MKRGGREGRQCLLSKKMGSRIWECLIPKEWGLKDITYPTQAISTARIGEQQSDWHSLLGALLETKKSEEPHSSGAADLKGTVL